MLEISFNKFATVLTVNFYFSSFIEQFLFGNCDISPPDVSEFILEAKKGLGHAFIIFNFRIVSFIIITLYREGNERRFSR